LAFRYAVLAAVGSGLRAACLIASRVAEDMIGSANRQ
jgi:hypothetical protein